MTNANSIEVFVRIAQLVVLQSKALFGFVFERTNDGSYIASGYPLTGAISDLAVLRQYYHYVGQQILSACVFDENRWRKVTAIPESAGVGRDWFVLIVTQRIYSPACVAVVYQFQEPDEAVAQLKILETEIESRQFDNESMRTLLKELQVAGYAIYRIKRNGDTEEMGLLSGFTASGRPSDSGNKTWEFLLDTVRKCYSKKTGVILPPHARHLPDESGRRRWHFILASDSLLEAGYVVSVALPANSEIEVRLAMTRFEDELSRTMTGR